MKKNVAKIGTIIGKGNVIGGDFTAPNSVRLDGEIEGNVTVGGLLVVGSKGKIVGNVTASEAIIGGEVYGDIVAPDKIEITETARVIGNIQTNVIVVDEKAVFQGSIDMYQEDVPAKKRRPSKESKAVKKTAKDALKEALREVDDEVKQQEEEQYEAY